MSLNTEGLSAADIAAVTGNNNSGWGGDFGSWIILFLIFGLFGGWGGRGFGGTTGGAADNYVLASDFSQVERKLDTVNAGLCDGFYAMNTGMLNGFAGVTNAITTGGYETRNAIQGIGSQLASCCCDIREGISGVNYNMAMNANNLSHQLSDCCCENEKAIMGVNYNMATQNAATLAAIDKVGDRIIDYMTTEKMSALRDENAALRLAASQSAQNTYLVNQLRPAPTPAYVVANPYCCNTTPAYGYGCGCGG